ncbi:MAG: aspartate kinase [Thermodesulfobacteriota bacterium]|nr:aspartate kinase [Thermodesulfobacteriota bacterium]
MGIVVQKYGGTSVSSIEKIKYVANKIVDRYRSGDKVVVVVSAMAGQTDSLINLAKDITSSPDPRELDVLASTGEQVSIALLAMAINGLGVSARSFLAYQIGLKTDNSYTRARILDIDVSLIKKALDAGEIAVVAGFQGVTEDKDVTTLGRGGSDTSAVALAAVLDAKICEIYTDVDGVYTTDPNICENARRLNKISYDEMLEMASLGARVLQIRSVEFAKKHNVDVLVKSTFNEGNGTLVTGEGKNMESVLVSGVTYDKDEAKITLLGVQDKPGVAATIFTPLAEESINVDMIIQNVSADGKHADLSFTVPMSDYERAMVIVRKKGEHLGARDVLGDTKIAKISIIGVGMRSHAGIAAKMFNVLSREGINIQMISTSEIKISCVIDEKYIELGIRVLHDAFNLDKQGGVVG